MPWFAKPCTAYTDEWSPLTNFVSLFPNNALSWVSKADIDTCLAAIPSYLSQLTIITDMKHLRFVLLVVFLAGSILPACKSTQTAGKEQPVLTQAGSTANAGSTTEPSSPAASAPEIPFDPSVRRGTLDNGLTYYIRHNAKPEKRAELRLAVNAGSLLETDEQQGLAHFLEHMAFNGTEHFPKNELIDYLEGIGMRFGAHLNAYTSFDETVYMLRVPTDSAEVFDKGMQIMEDWAHLLSFDPEEIEKERGVVIEEWRTRLGPNQRMQQKTLPIMLYKSRYAERLPIGKVEVLESFEHELLKQFYRDWYRPDLMAVAVVGDVDVDAVENMIREKFSRIPAPQAPKERPLYEIPNHEQTLVAIASDEEAPYNLIQLIYKHDRMPMENLKDYRRAMMDRLVSNMLNNRLSELLQSENPPFSFASSSYGPMMRTKDNFQSFAAVSPGQFLTGLEALVKENERAARHGFTATELEREKKSILTSLEQQYKERDKTDSRQLVGQYVQHYLSGQPVPGIENRLKLYQQFLPTITLEEVNARMKSYITEQNRVVVLTGSSKGGNQMPSEEAVLAKMAEVQQMELAAYEDEVIDAPLMAEKPQPGKLASKKQIEALKLTELTFDNGLKVILKPTDFKNDQILMRAYSPGGNSLYPDSLYMSASMADAVVAQSGLGPFDNVQLEKYLSDKVASVSPGISELDEQFRGSCSPQDVETFLQMVNLYFMQPRKDPIAFNAYMSRIKSLYSNLLEQPENYFQSELMKLLYNNHPRRLFPTPEMLEEVQLDQSYDIFRDRYADASDFTFFFVGNFDTTTFVPLLSQYLGSLPALNRKESWKDVGAEIVPGRIKQAFYKGKEPKSNVEMYFSGDYEWSPEENHRMNSMIQVLRIMMRESMREDKGGVYGVRASASPSRWPKGRYEINISFVCSPDNAEDLIATALKDIQTLKTEGPSAINLEKVKQIQRKEHEEGLKENNFWISYLYSSYVNGLDPLRIEQRMQQIDQLTAEEVKQAALKYFNDDNYIEAILYPEDKQR